MRHMHADLDVYDRFPDADAGGYGCEMFHNAVVGHRRFAPSDAPAIWVRLGRVTADRLFHCATAVSMTDRHRFVFTGDLAQLQQRLHQPGLRRNGFRHHHQTGVSLSRR